MISVSPWFLFCILNARSVIGVRIFQNVLPVPMPTKYVPYVPEVLSNTCMLKPDPGPCRGGIRMYYFSPDIQNCTSFIWGGCQGNGNRFNNRDECRNKCLSKQGGPKRRPKWCALTFDYGFCFGAVKRYYFDNLWKVCKTTIYSGCGGNRNNFYSHEQCESVCLYGNGYVTFRPLEETAPTKVLIINPKLRKDQGRMDDKRGVMDFKDQVNAFKEANRETANDKDKGDDKDDPNANTNGDENANDNEIENDNNNNNQRTNDKGGDNNNENDKGDGADGKGNGDVNNHDHKDNNHKANDNNNAGRKAMG